MQPLLRRILKLGSAVYPKNFVSKVPRSRPPHKVRCFPLLLPPRPSLTLFTPQTGFLHLLYIPVRFLLTRPFMRISFQLPERFANVSVGTVQWSVVEAESREAIEWVDKNEQILEGWFVGIYSFFVCCLVQVSLLSEPGEVNGS